MGPRVEPIPLLLSPFRARARFFAFPGPKPSLTSSLSRPLAQETINTVNHTKRRIALESQRKTIGYLYRQFKYAA